MKLMLAEDEPGLSRALTAILQHSDYEVDTALDGLTALEYLLANDYDAAILDIMMPRCPIRSRAWMPVPTII